MFKKICNSLFKQYYILLLFIHFITFNVLIENLFVSGILYILFLIILNIITIYIIIKYNKSLKFKAIIHLLFILYTLSFKNIYYLILGLTVIILLTILNFKENIIIKTISIIAGTFIVLNIHIISFAAIMSYKIEKGEIELPIFQNEIYEDTHYYCDNYEIYIYSAGAMDKFHYEVIEKNEIIDKIY